MRRRSPFGLLAFLYLAYAGICSSPEANFSGTWKQSNERCVPQRMGNVVRRIDQHGSDFVVETISQRATGPLRHALQTCSLDGRTSVSTGVDGDEFHTAIVRHGSSLVFSIEEHEGGRVILSTETWTLVENGSALEIRREAASAPASGTPKRTLVYLRQASDSGHP